MSTTTKNHDGSPIPRLEAEGKGTAALSESQEEVKIFWSNERERLAPTRQRGRRV